MWVGEGPHPRMAAQWREVPGKTQTPRKHWVFPAAVASPAALAEPVLVVALKSSRASVPWPRSSLLELASVAQNAPGVPLGSPHYWLVCCCPSRGVWGRFPLKAPAGGCLLVRVLAAPGSRAHGDALCLPLGRGLWNRPRTGTLM